MSSTGPGPRRPGTAVLDRTLGYLHRDRDETSTTPRKADDVTHPRQSSLFDAVDEGVDDPGTPEDEWSIGPAPGGRPSDLTALDPVERARELLLRPSPDVPREYLDAVARELGAWDLGLNPTDRNDCRRFLDVLSGLPFGVTPAWRTPEETERVLRTTGGGVHAGARDAVERFLDRAAIATAAREAAVEGTGLTGSETGGPGRGRALLLVGPPGVGKTHLARLLARSAGTTTFTVSLAGRDDSLGLTGARRDYSRSQPSVVTTGLVRAGRLNPVGVLDELDKAGVGGTRGAPTDVLLELLDPAGSFRDDYLELVVPTGQVVWIATANDLSRISPPLLDRCDVVEVGDFTQEELRRLVGDVLWPDRLGAVGRPGGASLSPQVLDAVLCGRAVRRGLRGTELRLDRLLGRLLRREPRRLADPAPITLAEAVSLVPQWGCASRSTPAGGAEDVSTPPGPGDAGGYL